MVGGGGGRGGGLIDILFGRITIGVPIYFKLGEERAKPISILGVQK